MAHANVERHLAYHREYNRKNGRAIRLRCKYGLSVEAYDALVEAQGGVCAICAQPETHKWRGKLSPLAVDHDHATNTVRGLLCRRCNVGIGMLGDSIAHLAAAIDYLERNTA